MKKYIGYIVLIVLMMVCFFVSGLFLVNSGLFDFKNGGINDEKGLQILKEIDTLPLVEIDVYDINFQVYGELIEVEEGEIVIESYGESLVFFYEGEISDFKKGEKIRVYYKYLPKGGKKISKICE